MLARVAIGHVRAETSTAAPLSVDLVLEQLHEANGRGCLSQERVLWRDAR